MNQRVQEQAVERSGAALLMTESGAGPVTALAIDVFLGDPMRFAEGNKASWPVMSGSFPSGYSGDGRQRPSGLRTQGNSLLRFQWCEAAAQNICLCGVRLCRGRSFSTYDPVSAAGQSVRGLLEGTSRPKSRARLVFVYVVLAVPFCGVSAMVPDPVVVVRFCFLGLGTGSPWVGSGGLSENRSAQHNKKHGNLR
jgi:hypothetical protein